MVCIRIPSDCVYRAATSWPLMCTDKATFHPYTCNNYLQIYSALQRGAGRVNNLFFGYSMSREYNSSNIHLQIYRPSATCVLRHVYVAIFRPSVTRVLYHVYVPIFLIHVGIYIYHVR